MIFTFNAICNKVYRLKLPQVYVYVLLYSSQLIRGQNWTVQNSKLKFSIVLLLLLLLLLLLQIPLTVLLAIFDDFHIHCNL